MEGAGRQFVPSRHLLRPGARKRHPRRLTVLVQLSFGVTVILSR